MKARKEADARELAAGAKRQQEAEAKAATGQAALTRMAKELKTAEHRERNRRIDEAAKRIAAERASKNKRALDASELRSRAATRLAELDAERQRLEGK
jgi:hypothetical protein